MSSTARKPAAAPTVGELVDRARALRPLLLERQAETEERAYYPEATHRELLEAGFYRMLVPRTFGGLELDVTGFARVVIEVARGCPSTGWSMCLPTGHALMVAGWFPEEAQAEIFGDGDFRCPAVAAPYGTATREPDGGWILDGTHAYCSGAPYGTHYLGQTFATGEPDNVILFVAPRSEWTMLDDWGDTLGLRGSGSHSIRFDGGHIPARYALERTSMLDVDVTGGSPGYRLHGNPMYAGRAPSFFTIELGALMLGMVRGALDEHAAIVSSRKTLRPPIVLRSHTAEYQRWHGLAAGRIEAAEAMLLACADQYMEACRRGVEDGVAFTRAEDLRLALVGNEVARICWETMGEHLYRTAGTGATRHGQRMERIFRDVSTAWGHYANVIHEESAREYGRIVLGAPADGPGAGQ
jgi:3-hydroxy-9,10-secoandrosta-1,3,5(10)-triene-9,17-dione monooxygenase